MIPILLMRKLRHGEVSSLPQNTGQKVLESEFKAGSEAQIQVLNHCTLLCLPSGEDKFIAGWRDHQDIEKPRGLEFRDKIAAMT